MNYQRSASKTAKATLGRLELRCPPLPQTLVEATKLIEEPEHLEVGPVTAMVQRDPIVVAKLLHIVNSSYYGLRRTINSVERTVVMLGPVAVAGIVVGMNILRLNAILEGTAARCFNRVIRHSIATAFLLRHLVEETNRPKNGAARGHSSRVGVSFTAGLLHDFGKIILVYNFPEEAVALYEKRLLDEQVHEPDVRDLEQLVFGCDHTEAGEFVARKLGFPDVLTDVIRFHHEPGRASGDPEVDRLIRATAAANLAAKAMGYTTDREIAWDVVALDPIWTDLIAYDLPHYREVTLLLDDLKQQHGQLDLYVNTMTSSSEVGDESRRVSNLSRLP